METEPGQHPTPEQIEGVAQHLQAALSEPLPNTHQKPPPFSPPSEMESLVRLSEVLVARVDQVARASAEQWGRVEQVLDQMVKTMQLAQVMIAQQAQQAEKVTDQIESLELTGAALVKINANLSEIVAALLSNEPPSQKGS